MFLLVEVDGKFAFLSFQLVILLIVLNNHSGDGLRLDAELLHGQSYTCETYNNDPLHGNKDDPEFICSVVEIYALV